jgi:hypothetical protein
MAGHAAQTGCSISSIHGETMPEEEDSKAKKPAAKQPAAKQPAAKKSPAKKAPKAEASEKKATGKPKADRKTPKSKAAAEKPADVQPAANEAAVGVTVTSDSVADNPLHKKLGLRPGAAGVVIAPPEGTDNPLLPLPEGFSVLAGIDELSALTGPYDYVHVFARDRADLAGAFSSLRDKLASGGSLWVSWMKQSSNRRGSGMVGDLNENVIRRIALMHGMVDVKVAALDRDWSALRLVHRKH